jgi:NAD(P)-dependent dehydrogenase (short-subunit alcohol dehydrogenase family)
MRNLDGKISIVTGAGRGLGQRAAIRLAALGSAVAIVARSTDQLQATANLIQSFDGKVIVIAADLGDPSSIDVVKDAVESQLGKPSVLVNAAGIFGPINLAWKTSPKEWIETLMINTVASYLTCHAFVPGMIDQGWGRVINVTSAAALHEPGPINSAYGTSKAALNQFTRHLASELDGTGVTANVIHPGDVKTDMWETIKYASEKIGPKAERYLQWAQWVEQTGGDDPERAADLIANITSSGSDNVNGQFLWIEGGLQAPVPSWGDPEVKQPWQIA